MTCTQVLDELSVHRHTLERWRTEGRFPEFRRLPNGQLRLRRCELDAWTESLESA
jgi:predicted site-specific integrase-resolvase